jgi:putative toxin-antitoxin system antitoxin component (TIGR02293 family)
MSVAESVARKLGGSAVIGREVRSQADLATVVRERLPLTTLKSLADAGLNSAEIESLIIPERTRRHRAQKGQPLTVEESDRVVRLLRIQSLAEETFGSSDKASRWLRRPLTELGGEAPLVVAQTGAGARVIETILGQIAWGAAA